MVKLLLGQGVNPDKPDLFGQTPFLLAARNGHEGAVKLILGQDSVNPTYQIILAEHHFYRLPALGTRER